MTSVSPTPKDTEAERREARREEVARAMHQAHHDRRGYFFDEPNATEAWESGGVDTRYWLLLADDALDAVLAASPAVTGRVLPLSEVEPTGEASEYAQGWNDCLAATTAAFASPAVTEGERAVLHAVNHPWCEHCEPGPAPPAVTAAEDEADPTLPLQEAITRGWHLPCSTCGHKGQDHDADGCCWGADAAPVGCGCMEYVQPAPAVTAVPNPTKENDHA